MPSFHSVARQQHLKQERKEKMNNQITLVIRGQKMA